MDSDLRYSLPACGPYRKHSRLSWPVSGSPHEFKLRDKPLDLWLQAHSIPWPGQKAVMYENSYERCGSAIKSPIEFAGKGFYRKSLLIRYTLCSALILSKRCPLSNNFFGLAISQRNNCCHQRYILLSVLSNHTHFLFLGGWRGGVNNNFKRGYETGLPNISLCLVTWTFREASRSIAAYFPELVTWHQISKE